MKIALILSAILFCLVFSAAAQDSPLQAIDRYSNLQKDIYRGTRRICRVYDDRADTINLENLKKAEVAAKKMLIGLYKKCMTGELLEATMKEMQENLAKGSCLTHTDYSDYLFRPYPIANSLPAQLLINEPGRKVYHFRGRVKELENYQDPFFPAKEVNYCNVDQTVTVIKTDKGWRVEKFTYLEPPH